MFESRDTTKVEAISPDARQKALVDNFSLYQKCMAYPRVQNWIRSRGASVSIQKIDGGTFVGQAGSVIISWRDADRKSRRSTVFCFTDSAQEFRSQILAFFSLRNELNGWGEYEEMGNFRKSI